MGSDQNDWLRRNTLTPEQKEAERRAFSMSWSRSKAKILAREQEHAIYGTFQSSPITVDSISAAGASIDAVPSMPQREAMGAAVETLAEEKLWRIFTQQAVKIRAQPSGLPTDGVDPDFEVKPPKPAPPSDLPTDPELRELVLNIRKLAK